MDRATDRAVDLAVADRAVDLAVVARAVDLAVVACAVDLAVVACAVDLAVVDRATDRAVDLDNLSGIFLHEYAGRACEFPRAFIRAPSLPKYPNLQKHPSFLSNQKYQYILFFILESLC